VVVRVSWMDTGSSPRLFARPLFWRAFARGGWGATACRYVIQQLFVRCLEIRATRRALGLARFYRLGGVPGSSSDSRMRLGMAASPPPRVACVRGAARAPVDKSELRVSMWLASSARLIGGREVLTMKGPASEGASFEPPGVWATGNPSEGLAAPSVVSSANRIRLIGTRSPATRPNSTSSRGVVKTRHL